MKKLLSIFVFGIAIMVLPVGAKALELGFDCEKSCRNEETGKCEQTCELYIDGNTSSMTTINPTFTITGDADKVSLGSLTAANDNIIATASRNGDVISMEFLATTAITDKRFELGTLVLELEDNAVDCSGYFSLDGVEYEVEVDVTTEVDTGATLPIAILACGAGAGVVIYAISRKNKKMYKI